jgi:hypothetical protein
MLLLAGHVLVSDQSIRYSFACIKTQFVPCAVMKVLFSCCRLPQLAVSAKLLCLLMVSPLHILACKKGHRMRLDIWEGSQSRHIVLSPAGLVTKNHCTGEGQQKFSSQSVGICIIFVVRNEPK